MRLLFPLIVLIVTTGEACAQTATVPPSRTMASLVAEGYEPQTVQIFKDKIWMRKPGDLIAYICDRGRINSPAFNAYRTGKYEEVQCSLAQ